MEPGNPNFAPGIKGSVDRPRRWVHTSQENTHQFIFGEYIDEILTNMETCPVPGGYDNKWCLMWDNLSLHKAAYVTTIIKYRTALNNFYSVDCPPYRPITAPIEYLFCELTAELNRRCERGWDIDELRCNIFNVCATIEHEGKLCSTYIHCD